MSLSEATMHSTTAPEHTACRNQAPAGAQCGIRKQGTDLVASQRHPLLFGLFKKTSQISQPKIDSHPFDKEDSV